jgi:hypothetical protein
VTKLVNQLTVTWNGHAGTYGVQSFNQTPDVGSMIAIFGAAFAFNGASASYDNTKPGQNGFYGANAKIALEARRADEFINLSNFKTDVIVYRIVARDHLTSAVVGNLYTQIDTYIKGLLDVTTTKQVSGAVLANPSVVIGVTPYDSPTFCSAFKITRRKQFTLRPNGKKKIAYKCRPRLYTGLDINTYSILKGSIIDLYYTKGQLGKWSTAATGGLASLVSTTPTELGCATRWDYTFVPEARTNVAVDKYINQQMPNDLNSGNLVGANDAQIRIEQFSNLVPTTQGLV